MSNAGLVDAARSLDALAAGIKPNHAEVISGAIALNTLPAAQRVRNDLQLAALGLEILATSRNLDLEDVSRRYAGKLAEAVRKLIPTP
jgi:hypothetical protein